MKTPGIRWLTLMGMCMGVVTILASAGQAWAAFAPNSEAIAEVRNGQRKVAHASWWGFKPEDSTRALQAAIDSGAEKVVVENTGEPWVVDKIRLAGNQEIMFERGVQVIAKRGAFQGRNDSLFAGVNLRNVKLTGPGAVLRMWRQDYATTNYSKAEWRHVLNIRSCTNVQITGLTLAESGGDGIYLGVGAGGGPNWDVVIKEVACDGNYRQGISVISAGNLTIEDCVLRNTAGTPPAAGIDFEPNHSREKLVNCVMRNCVSENNQGVGFDFYLGYLSATSAPVSIRLENCVARGTNRSSIKLSTATSAKGAVDGQIEFIDCRFEDRLNSALWLGPKPAAAAKVRFERCSFKDAAPMPQQKPPIILRSALEDVGPVGAIEFADCIIDWPGAPKPMDYEDHAGVGIKEIAGSFRLRRPGGEQTVALDATVLAEWLPTANLKSIPRLPLKDLRLGIIDPATRLAGGQLPDHRLRGTACWLVYANKGERVTFQLGYQPVGRYSGGNLPVQILAPDGSRVASLTAAFRAVTAGEFVAPADAVYRIRCQPEQNTAALTQCSHAVWLVTEEGLLRLVRTSGDFFFYVPSSTAEFGVRVSGQSPGEAVKATVFDPAGNKVWEEDDVTVTRMFAGAPRQTGRGEVWRLRLDKPGSLYFEDHCVDLRGIPPILSFSPKATLRRLP